MRFVKVEGAGNDYVLVDTFDQRIDEPAALARVLSDRHVGIGSDGLLLVGADDDGADATMRIFNADGSEGLMCGNGLRCVVRHLIESGRVDGPDVTVATASGKRVGRLLEDGGAEVAMGVPDFAMPDLPAPPELGADPNVAYGVSVGNPHLVVRVPDPEDVDLRRFGIALQGDDRLKDGANVHFVRLAPGDRLVARPWERGSGATRACGSGAVAVAAVARRLGWIDDGHVAVVMPGGELAVRFDDDGTAWLAGPARIVFRGEWRRP